MYFYVDGKILKLFKFGFTICALIIYTRCLGESMKLPDLKFALWKGLSLYLLCCELNPRPCTFKHALFFPLKLHLQPPWEGLCLCIQYHKCMYNCSGFLLLFLLSCNNYNGFHYSIFTHLPISVIICSLLLFLSLFPLLLMLLLFPTSPASAFMPFSFFGAWDPVSLSRVVTGEWARI